MQTAILSTAIFLVPTRLVERIARMQQSAKAAYRRRSRSGSFARWLFLESRPPPRSACVCSRLLRAANAAAQMRIVSLAPSVTETLFALGAGPEVVGVSQYCDYPPQVRDLPRVGSFLTPNLEAIIALRPDAGRRA